MTTYYMPRRFIILNRDDLATTLVEGVQWSNGGVSLMYHKAPWVEASRGRSRALVGVAETYDYPSNESELETMAAVIWGKMHWLDSAEVEADHV